MAVSLGILMRSGNISEESHHYIKNYMQLRRAGRRKISLSQRGTCLLVCTVIPEIIYTQQQKWIQWVEFIYTFLYINAGFMYTF